MAAVKSLESSWCDWIVSNLQHARSPESIISEMVDMDFDAEFASSTVARLARVLTKCPAAADKKGFLAGVFGADSTASRARTSIAWKPDANYCYEPSQLPAGNMIRTSDRAIQVLLRLAKPEVLLFSEVLTAPECSELIARSREKLARSTTVDPRTGERIVVEERSSFGTCFRLNEDEFIARIDHRLSQLLNWPVEQSEGLQVLRYQIGGEYKPHFDYFPPSSPGNKAHLANGGQRVASLVMYLNDVHDGGETIFPDIGIAIVPRRGHAVYFSYCNSRNQLDPLTLHGGAPVRQGMKWIATKWLRQHRRT